MRLQYRLSNGSWIDCGDRTEEFLTRCVAYAGGDREKIMTEIAEGKDVRHRGDDWYAMVRDGEVADQKRDALQQSQMAAAAADKRPVLRCKSCGATGHAGAYPFSTLPGSGCCDDCI
jgi:hypothetical protein